MTERQTQPGPDDPAPWITGSRAFRIRRLAGLAALLTMAGPAFAAEVTYQLAIHQSSGSSVIESWDFNAPGLPSNMTVIAGAWQPVTNAGPDGSACMETYSNTTQIALNVSPDLLPIEITYRHAVKYPQPQANVGTCWTWSNDQDAALVIGLSRLSIRPPAKGQTFCAWYSSRMLLDDKYVLAWDWQTNSVPGNIVILKRPAAGQLIWGIYGMQRVDDLTIRRARIDETPAILKQCLEAIDRLPPAKRTGTVTLPGVKSATGEEVRVQFLPEGLSRVR